MNSKLLISSILMICSFLFISSCDTCGPQNCENGSCVNGSCECDPGYYGSNCEHQELTSQLIVFLTEDCGCGQVSVSISGGQSDMITAYHSSGNPSCGASGAATFTVDAGSITVSAYCSGISWSTTVNVAEGTCTKLQLNCDGTTGTGGGGGSSGYNCISGSCTYVSSGATYSTLQDCNNSCGVSSAGYDCVSGTCTYVSSGATYSTLSACENNCGGTPTCGLPPATFYGNGNNCGSSNVHVSPSNCCPTNTPYWCSYTNGCYATCDEAIAVCDGEFNKVQKGIPDNTPPSQYANGEVMFYVTSPITCGQLRVYLTNSGGSTVNEYVTEPSQYFHCGAKGAATFDVSPGDYTYEITCGTDTWNGSLTITSYECEHIQVY